MMRALVLAAGRGERMRPLTDTVPKPLLMVRGHPLIDYHLLALAKAGFTEVIVNVHHLRQPLMEYLGDGSRFGLHIRFSVEEVLLETAGGIRNALPLLGPEPFAVISADVFTEFDYCRLFEHQLASLAHLVMIDNPPHHAEGDFTLGADGVLGQSGQRLTYSGIGVYTPAFFGAEVSGPQKLRELMEPAIAKRLLTGEYFGGAWFDVGTPARLAAINR